MSHVILELMYVGSTFAIISVVCYYVYLPVSTCILYLGENIYFEITNVTEGERCYRNAAFFPSRRHNFPSKFKLHNNQNRRNECLGVLMFQISVLPNYRDKYHDYIVKRMLILNLALKGHITNALIGRCQYQNISHT